MDEARSHSIPAARGIKDRLPISINWRVGTVRDSPALRTVPDCALGIIVFLHGPLRPFAAFPSRLEFPCSH